jgi:sugar-specific transcriptional regulator TrmB
MEMEILEEVGLTKRESSVYLALLQLNETTVGPIIAKSGIPNSKIYDTLDKLKNKGLVSFVVKSNKKHYQAADPKHILELLEEKKNKLKEILPELQRKRKFASVQHSATVFEGFDGLKSAFRNMLNELNPKDEYLVFTTGEKRDEQTELFFKNHHERRIELGVHVKLIAPTSLRHQFKKRENLTNLRLRYTLKILPTGVYIYNNKVMHITEGDQPVAFVIQSQQHTQRYREFLNEMLQKATK